MPKVRPIGEKYGYKHVPGGMTFPTRKQARAIIADAVKIEPMPKYITPKSMSDWVKKTGAFGINVHTLRELNLNKR